MPRMTDQEAEYWDDYYTKNTIMPDSNKPGFFARQKGMTAAVDPVSAAHLRAQAEAAHQTPADLASAIIREKLVKSA